MNLMDWGQFFDQMQTESRPWQIAFLALFTLPLLLRLCAQAELEAKHEPSIKSFLKLLGNGFPLLNRMRIYLFSWRFDLWLCAALGVVAALILADRLSYESLFLLKPPEKEPLLDVTADYWLLLYGLLLLPGLLVLQLWDSAIEKIKQCAPRGTVGSSRRVQPDIPIELGDDDLFGWGNKAKVFSNAVLAAPDGMAFGVEAPWGTGKTSFINLCELQWHKPCIVYRFELLKYAGNLNIIEQFVLGLLDELEQHHYLPELRCAVQGYLVGLQGALELSGGPLKVTLNSQPSLIEDALQQIASQFERRLPGAFCLIVVIDDLDRVAPENVRDLLFALHKCFALPRLRYVLCYDQQQLAHKAELHRQHGSDLASQTLHEFLDKFVAARVYLHSNYQGLESYVLKRLLPKLKLNSYLSNEWHDLVKEIFVDGALALLKEGGADDHVKIQLYAHNAESPKFERNHIYWTLLGNIRQLKWLFNQILLCWQSGLDLIKHEFNARDLVYLLLLQHSFPDLFRRLRAKAQSGEYLIICEKNKNVKSTNLPNDKLSEFIEEEQRHYLNNPWAKSAVEVLLRGLFDENIPFMKYAKTAKQNYRAREDYRLSAYFYLILQEEIPPKKSSRAYFFWIQMQWQNEGKALHDLLSVDVLKRHADESENWYDQHEYALWEMLFDGVEHYNVDQQAELVVEYLKALPRFVAHPRVKFCHQRVSMANLLGDVLRSLLIRKNSELAKRLLIMAWFDTEFSMLKHKDPIESLVGWNDAVLSCWWLHAQEVDEKFRYFIQMEFWNNFIKNYPKFDMHGQLESLSKALQGTRENIGQQEESGPREWLVCHWAKLHALTALGPSTEWYSKSNEAMEKFLFENCWGDTGPTDEQLCWWIDYVFYNIKPNHIGFDSVDQIQSFNAKFKSYAIRHALSIDRVLQQRCQPESEAKKLGDALTFVCGMPWSEVVKN